MSWLLLYYLARDTSDIGFPDLENGYFNMTRYINSVGLFYANYYIGQ